MTHESNKWLRRGDSVCFPLTVSVPMSSGVRRKNRAFSIPNPVTPPHPQRHWLSPGAPSGMACGCSVPGQKLQPHLSQQIPTGLTVFPSCLLAVAPATPIAQRNSKSSNLQIVKEFTCYHITWACTHPSSKRQFWAWPALAWKYLCHLYCGRGLDPWQYSSCIGHCTGTE